MFLAFNVAPTNLFVISLFLILLFGSLTMTSSIIIFFIKRNKTNAPQRYVYRSNFKKSLYIGIGLTLLLVLRLLFKYFVIKSL